MSAAFPTARGQRPRHHKRLSSLRLSSDSALPAYTSPPHAWAPAPRPLDELDVPSDQPPDYPDSAEEADADTETDEYESDDQALYLPHRPPSAPVSSASFSSSSLSHPRSGSRLGFPRAARRAPAHGRPQKSRHASGSGSGSHPVASSSTDPYLDALLARSVHALEMSNALLHSSMSTQSSLSAVLGGEDPYSARARSHTPRAHPMQTHPRSRPRSPDRLREVEARARGLSSRIRDTTVVHASWKDDLDAMTREVEGLFGGPPTPPPTAPDPDPDPGHDPAGPISFPISQSLPNASLAQHMGRARRRPSLDLRLGTAPATAPAPASPDAAQLQFTNHGRHVLVSPPPRAITFYADSRSAADASAIALPSTLGLRGAPSSFVGAPGDWRLRDVPTTVRRPTLNKTSASEPALPGSQTGSPQKALKMLSAVMEQAAAAAAGKEKTRSAPWSRSAGSRSSSQDVPSPRPCRAAERAETSPSLHGSSRSSTPRISPSPVRGGDDESGTSSATASPASRRSRSLTPKRLDSHVQCLPRIMSSIDELDAPTSSGSSSDHAPDVERTLQSLRKILSEQPAPPPPPTPPAPARPRFMPVTPPVAAASGTTAATASVSRLFTKGAHATSARGRSPPKQSALKGRPRPQSLTTSGLENGNGNGLLSPGSPALNSSSSAPGAARGGSLPPTPTPSLLSLPGLALAGTWSSGSRGSTAPSTPRRISFAQLPESYASTKPAGSSAEFDRARTKGKKGKARAGSVGAKERESAPGPWWSTWLLGAAAAGPGGMAPRHVPHEERVEERIGRAQWGRPGFGSSVEDWGM